VRRHLLVDTALCAGIVAAAVLSSAAGPEPVELRPLGVRAVEGTPAPNTTTSTTTTTAVATPTTTATATTTAAAAPAGHTVTDDQLAQLAQCESGGNPTMWDGRYGGAYSFLPSTWRSLDSTEGWDMPHHAPLDVQDAAVRELVARNGWGQFPGCARKFGWLP